MSKLDSGSESYGRNGFYWWVVSGWCGCPGVGGAGTWGGKGVWAEKMCRGFVTADVLAKGLSRGAIATGLLEGVKADTKTRGFYTSSAPSMKVKAYV